MAIRQARKRVHALESVRAARRIAGCETCRAYAGIVLMDDDGRLSRPETCPDCGRSVPIVRFLHIVGVPLDLP
jgi:hypothetical protein